MNATKQRSRESYLRSERCLEGALKRAKLFSHTSFKRNSAQVMLARPSTLILFFLLSVQIGAGREVPRQLRGFNHKLQTGQSVTIAAIGDSITWICFHTDGKQNYVTFIADALKQAYPRSEIHLVLAGNLGSTPKGLEHLQRDVLDHKPDLVFIMFGMNDCVLGPGNLDAYDSNLTEMIRRTRVAGAVPIILTQDDIVYQSEDGKRRLALPKYERRAVQVARRENCLFVDNFSDWRELKRHQPSNWSEYLDDAIHPNLAGHRRFAKCILEKLWPEAAKFQYSGLHPPLAVGRLRPFDCLLPGPIDKQVLRINRTTWLALSGRRRGNETTDLILSFCKNCVNPTWTEFRHVTLVGPAREAVFDWSERPINSGMVLLGSGRLFIAFTQTVRLNLLTVDTTKPGWVRHLADTRTYSTIVNPHLPLPQSMQGSYQEDCELLDGFLGPEGRPAFVLRDLVLGNGSGVALLMFSHAVGGYKESLIFKNFSRALVGYGAKRGWFIVGDARPGGRLVAACSQLNCPSLPPITATQFHLAFFQGIPLLICRTANKPSLWAVYRDIDRSWQRLHLPSGLQHTAAIGLLTYAAQPTLLSMSDGRASVYLLSGVTFMLWGSPQEPSPREPWRYEGRPPSVASSVGILWNNGRLEFSTVRLP